MDAFAITGVSPRHEWFRLQGAVGGEQGPAKLFPRIHVVSPSEIADLASGGRRIYFRQSEAAGDVPLVPLGADDAAAFEPGQLPLDELPHFAFLEDATDEDIQALLVLRKADGLPDDFDDAIARLEALGWIAQDADGIVALTEIGSELLRRRLT